MSAATLDRIKEQPANPVPPRGAPGGHSSGPRGEMHDRILLIFRSKPHLKWTVKEIASQVKLRDNATQYHFARLLKEGAIEKVPGSHSYQANTGYKTIEEKRAIIAQNPKPMEYGESWQPGGTGFAISTKPHFKYFERHVASIRTRIAAAVSSEDLEAFDELTRLAFPQVAAPAAAALASTNGKH